MAKRLFVGNLSFSIDEQKLVEIFSAIGKVVSAKIITDKFTNQSRGFGFVEMSTDEEATNAIKQLNDTEHDGRKIVVNEAKPLEDRPTNGFNRGGGGGGYSRDGGNDRHGGGGGYNRGGGRGGRR